VARGTIEDPLAAISPWVGLALAALLAAGITIALTSLTRRELERSSTSTKPEASA
jgi:hypothetical protein